MRRLTSGPFNDENNSLVWSESIGQAEEVLEHWASQRNPITDTVKHLRTLSLHVLSNAGFGKRYSFQEAAELPKPGCQFNYRDSLEFVINHIMILLILGPGILRNRFAPKFLRKIGQAAADFKEYMKDMFHDEERYVNNKTQSFSILSAMLRESDEMVKKQIKTGSSRSMSAAKGLSESEIYGNIFVYNFAGHDTTAITFSWAVYLLAAHPEFQDWIGAEISHYVLNDNCSLASNFSHLFPKLKRCRAIMVSKTLDFSPWFEDQADCRSILARSAAALQSTAGNH